MERFFLKIYDFFAKGRRKWAIIIPVLLSLFFAFAATRVNLSEDIAGFLPYGNGKSHRQSQFVYKNLRMADKIVIVFSADEADSHDGGSGRVNFLTGAADDFVSRFEAGEVPGAKDPQLRVDALKFLETAGFVISNMPYFLEEQDYTIIDSVISAGDPREIFEKDKEQILSSEGYFSQDIILSDPLHIGAPVLKRLSQMGMESGYSIIGDYIFTADSSRIIMTLASESGGSETKKNALLVSKLGELADSTMAANKGLNISLLGSPVIAVSNAARMSVDAVRCAVLSVMLIVLLLAWYFRKTKPILLICLPLVFGVLSGLAFMGLFVPDVSSVALSASCVIFGIGVDYALLYSTRLGFAGDSRTALKDIVSPMVVGNITTVGAFLSLLVMSAAGMRDFGLFAAISLVGTILFVILFLPHWVGDRHYKSREDGWIAKWANLNIEERRFVPSAFLLLSVVFLISGFNVGFSGDFTKINYMDSAQKESMEELGAHANSAGNIAVYAVAQGNTFEEALENYEKTRPFADSAVFDGLSVRSSGIGGFLPSAKMQAERIGRWNKWLDTNRQRLLGILERYPAEVGFSKDAFVSFRDLLNRDFGVRTPDYFAPLNSVLQGYIMRDTSGRSMIMTVLQTPRENLAGVYGGFEKFAQGLAPDGTAQDDTGPFLFDSYTMTDEMIDVLQGDFDKVLFICSLLVFIFLLIALGRPELALTAFLPMVLSWIWITGLMGIFGVEFNIVNIILATFIFGLGDDYTIFMLEGLSYEYATHKKLLSSYKTGVTLSAITMFIGIGSLVFAVHPALRSLGEVAVIGMSCVVAMAFVLPPLIFRWIVKVKGERGIRGRYIPLRISDILITFLCGAVFSALCLQYKILVALGRRMSEEKFRVIIHRRMLWFSRNLPRVKTRVKGQLDIEKPCLITCNHQSHLDIMYLLALSPKLVFLTNKWVSKSPVYGDIIGKLGFICIQDSISDRIDELRRAVDKGYSIVIFPEGTRSEDCGILKFHSGTFHIASELKTDILPIVVHGIGHVLPKHDPWFRPGTVTIDIKSRIPYSGLQDSARGNISMAKWLERYYVAEYEKLRAECETLQYLKGKILGLYLYKGAELQKLVNKQFRQLALGGVEERAAVLPEKAELVLDADGTALEAVIYCMLRRDIVVKVRTSGDEFTRSMTEVLSKEFGGRLNVG